MLLFSSNKSWLPLLFIPTNASPAFIFLFFVCTYFLNRPCVYCSVLLVILFLSSCHWSDRCFFDFGSNWFQARVVPPPSSLLLVPPPSSSASSEGRYTTAVPTMIATPSSATTAAA